VKGELRLSWKEVANQRSLVSLSMDDDDETLKGTLSEIRIRIIKGKG
jgi:hypothetical protein